MLRLELGIPADLLGIARVCRSRITRVEYLRLRGAGLGTLDGLSKVNLKDLAEQLGGEKARAKTVRELAREAKKLEPQAA